MLKIGLTGGIGSGKSEVSKFFNLWGAYILKEVDGIGTIEEISQNIIKAIT